MAAAFPFRRLRRRRAPNDSLFELVNVRLREVAHSPSLYHLTDAVVARISRLLARLTIKRFAENAANAIVRRRIARLVRTGGHGRRRRRRAHRRRRLRRRLGSRRSRRHRNRRLASSSAERSNAMAIGFAELDVARSPVDAEEFVAIGQAAELVRTVLAVLRSVATLDHRNAFASARATPLVGRTRRRRRRRRRARFECDVVDGGVAESAARRSSEEENVEGRRRDVHRIDLGEFPAVALVAGETPDGRTRGDAFVVRLLNVDLEKRHVYSYTHIYVGLLTSRDPTVDPYMWYQNSSMQASQAKSVLLYSGLRRIATSLGLILTKKPVWMYM